MFPISVVVVGSTEPPSLVSTPLSERSTLLFVTSPGVLAERSVHSDDNNRLLPSEGLMLLRSRVCAVLGCLRLEPAAPATSRRVLSRSVRVLWRSTLLPVLR
jgi:hypothetical protein